MVVLLYSVCCVVWGTTWAVIRVGLQDLPPFGFAALRMTAVAIALLPWMLRDRRNVLQLCGIGVLQFGFSYALVFAAETTIDSGLTAVLFGTFPLWTLIMSRLFLPDERLAPRHVAAICLGFVGLVVMHFTASQLNTYMLLPVGSAILSAISSVWTKRIASDTSPFVTLGYNSAAGAVVLWLLHVNEAPIHFTTRGALSVAYLTIFGSIVAFSCLLWLLKRIPIALIGFMTFVEALFGVIVGIAFLGEHPEPRVLIGSGIVLLSIGVAHNLRS